MMRSQASAQELASRVAAATAGSPNEASLRHEIEKLLEDACRALGIPWIPFQLDRTLRTRNGATVRYADVAHGAVIVEYERPASFGGQEGANVAHARRQAEEYGHLLREEEGRRLEEYVLVAWDGAHITFGRFESAQPQWERLRPFDRGAAQMLLDFMEQRARPLAHPLLLSQLVGPESGQGVRLIPALYRALRRAMDEGATTSKTLLLFTEWRRLFGQVAGVQSERLRVLLARQEQAHEQSYADDPASYLFALNTYIAIVAKLVAALSLPGNDRELLDATVPVRQRIESLESGAFFRAAGISNMLAGDFFSWYLDDSDWPVFGPKVASLIDRLNQISFNLDDKSPESTRDLFKGLYQSFVPRALRHALGEYYTPDWLAAHALDVIEWNPEDPLLDPTCGSGTFLLEALRRRINGSTASIPARKLMKGLYGIDLNPLAVLSARASLVVSLAPYLDPDDPLTLPVYLADAINPAEADGQAYRHDLQTERGMRSFDVPRQLVEAAGFFGVFARLRELVEAERSAEEIVSVLKVEYPDEVGTLSDSELDEFSASAATLVDLHENGWDGIWCAILADRFAAGSIPQVSFIVGNPPWVKWSHLPPEYASFIKDRCMSLGVFSEDRWVGGIESDISTVITYEVVDKWLAPQGVLAFFITGTVFSNESSQGFRRFALRHRELALRVRRVEDFAEVAPFEGVSNHATLLVVERDGSTEYPVPYLVWHPPRDREGIRRSFRTADDFRETATQEHLLAQPVPGTDAGPWLKGSLVEQQLWSQIFGSSQNYTARKGITTDRNGIFFVRVLKVVDARRCMIANDPGLGRIKGIPRVREVVESAHLFPLLRGRGVSAFSAVPDPEYRVLLPQRHMHGDPDLAVSAPGAYRFLKRFKEELERRSSYRRFQRGQPYWSVWSTGPYTFSSYKVVWREMPGSRFVAAMVGKFEDPTLGERLVIPDHKLYFVPVEEEAEAAYLTGVLNAPCVTRAISAYASQLSLGISVVEYLDIPRYKPTGAARKLSELALAITARGDGPDDEELVELDALARRLFDAQG